MQIDVKKIYKKKKPKINCCSIICLKRFFKLTQLMQLYQSVLKLSYEKNISLKLIKEI